MDIKNKVIILTGAARIGQDVAKSLLEKGAKLTVAYNNHKPDLGSEVLYIKADLTSPSEVANVVAETKKYFGQIDGLVHMAANYEKTKWADLNDETWNKSMRPIARTAYLMSKTVGDELLKNKNGGKIILISDWSVL